MAQQVLELLLERGVLARFEIAALELGDRCDEGFRNEAPAVLAVVAARVGIAMAESRNDGLQAASYDCSDAKNARSLVSSLIPGAASTPDDTSTAYGWTVAVALFTFSGLRPPDRMTGRSRAAAAATPR